MDNQANFDLVFEAMQGYLHASAFKAAIDIGLFTAIARGKTTCRDIAQSTEASERGVRALANLMVTRQFLTKSGEHYALSPTAATYLSKDSPAYCGSMTQFILSAEALHNMSEFTTFVRQGGNHSKNNNVAPDHPVWAEFAQAMMPMAAPVARATADILARVPARRVLDIASSHGLYGIECAQKFPEACVVALDWPGVIPFTKKSVERVGLTARYSFIVGDAFKSDLQGPYDLILIPNLLHHFSQADNLKLIARCKAALNPGGRIATVEFVPNEDRVTPRMPAAFASMMLSSTAEGDAYPLSSYQALFKDAGFATLERHDLLPTSQTLLVAH